MPKLGQSKIVKVTLPSSVENDEAWVRLNLGLTAGEVLDVRESADGLAQMSATTIEKAVHEWNFTDDDGKIVPITEASVRQMQAKDFNHISDLLLATVRVQSKPVGKNEKKA